MTTVPAALTAWSDLDSVEGHAPYASHANSSRGRRQCESDIPAQHAYQCDRDRIVHCTAFRRLVYKTQVFLNHEGDLFRTRLTHSLEVAHLARAMSRALGLNEALVEAIALAHDLGHTPFGHAGQVALNQCMQWHGGFEHNRQSLRVVDQLEERYPDFNGLNLTFETREGILKHCSLAHARAIEATEPSGVASRFLTGTQASLEAQLCNIADELAYSAHDIDDGVRSGLLAWASLPDVPVFGPYWSAVQQAYPELGLRRALLESIRRMLADQVQDLIASTRAVLAQLQPTHADEVRAQSQPLCQFSPAMKAHAQALKHYLWVHLYRHPQVETVMTQAQEVVRDLFEAYTHSPSSMPPGFACQENMYRASADYIAGMTDRFARKVHQQLTGRRVFDRLGPDWD